MRHGFEFIHHATQINLPADGSLFSDRILSVRASTFNVMLERVHIVVSGQVDTAGVYEGDEVATRGTGDTGDPRDAVWPQMMRLACK